MIKTHVTWNKISTAEEQSLIDERVTQMVQEEKTNGNMSLISESEDGKTFERTWNTIEAAEEWLSFIQTFNPTSAILINE
jgi:hypothetical protein